ncbi:MAG: ATP-binding protein, partial [Spirochaetota bacterium]|nr:ATP-binding protein [Spirochaetota bacterium]
MPFKIMVNNLSFVKKIVLFFLLFGIIFSVFTACGTDFSGRKAPVAVNGVIDLSDWNYKKDGPVNLDGQWEFYWNQLLEPSDFQKKDNLPGQGFINLPGLWKNNFINGTNLPGKGYATYRLQVIVNQDKKIKALSINNILSAYKLWINGKLVHQKGIVDKSEKAKEQFVFLYHKKILAFTLSNGMNEIVLQILNYHYDSGGIKESLELGDGELSYKKYIQDYTMNMMVVGLLLFISIYNIFLYSFRKDDIFPLIFGIFSLLWTINIFNIQSTIIYDFFSNHRIPYLIDNFLACLTLPLGTMLIKKLSHDEFSIPVLRFSQVSPVVVIFIMLFTGFEKSEIVISTYGFLICLIFIYYVYVLIRNINQHKDDAKLFFFGFIVVFIVSINDLLYSFRIFNSGIYFHYALLVLGLCTTIVASRRFSRAFHEVKELSKELENNNIALTEMDRIKDEFLANTSHELRNPLHGIIGMSESMIEGATGRLPSKTVENLSLIASSGHRLKNLVNDLLDMANIQDKSMELNIKPVDISTLINLVVKLSLPLVGEKPLVIINSIRQDIPPVMGDEDRIMQVMHNLIGNAIKFTNKGTVEISASLIDTTDESYDSLSEQMLEVRVSDTGIGVPEEYKEKIFESFQQVDGTDARSYPGTGLGLAITKQLVELQRGTIRVMSEINKGSVFAFTLPVSNISLPGISDDIIIGGSSELSSRVSGETESQF